MSEFEHTTVLLQETVDELNVVPDGIYVDGTFGGGGHTRYLLSQLTSGRVIAFDQDQVAITNGKSLFQKELESGKLVLIHRNFKELTEALLDLGITSVNGLLFDLGVSSPQFDVPERGFSYRFDAPLDMRMDQSNPLTAKIIVNEYSFNDLMRIFSRYGEERFSKAIARKIEKERQKAPIETTLQLVDIIRDAIPAPARRAGGHPAKRVFQALRIAVNDELGAVESVIEQGLKLLKPGGRMSVISFHSLEDRIVKTMYKEVTTPPQTPHNLPILPSFQQMDYQLVTRKPILPSEKELEKNSRASSAKLRVIERVKK